MLNKNLIIYYNEVKMMESKQTETDLEQALLNN